MRGIVKGKFKKTQKNFSGVTRDGKRVVNRKTCGTVNWFRQTRKSDAACSLWIQYYFWEKDAERGKIVKYGVDSFTKSEQWRTQTGTSQGDGENQERNWGINRRAAVCGHWLYSQANCSIEFRMTWTIHCIAIGPFTSSIAIIGNVETIKTSNIIKHLLRDMI